MRIPDPIFRLFNKFTGMVLGCFILWSCAGDSNAHLSPSLEQGTSQGGSAMPYEVDGKTYYPLRSAVGFTEEGIASWYGPGFHGKPTSSQEIYNMNSMTAAHRVLPFDTRVQVHNLENDKTVTVRINDRGPFVNDRILDLSYAAAKKLGIIEQGTAAIELTVVAHPRLDSEGSDESGEPDRYKIQLAFFKNEESARRLKKQVRKSQVEPVFKKGRSYYRVVVGDYSKFEDAVRRRNEIRDLGFSGAFVIRD